MKVLLFSLLQEEIGSSINLDLNTIFTAQDVKNAVADQFPDFKELLDQSFVAVNEECINEEKINIEDVQTIAIIPPVSGG